MFFINPIVYVLFLLFFIFTKRKFWIREIFDFRFSRDLCVLDDRDTKRHDFNKCLRMCHKVCGPLSQKLMYGIK